MDARSARKTISLPRDFDGAEDVEVLQERCQQLRALYTRATASAERERLRLARQIHDDLAQRLTALSLDLSLLDQSVTSGKDKDLTPESLHKRLKGLIGLVGVTVQSARKLTADLLPRTLEEFGLAAALGAYAAEFQRHTGVHCEFNAEPAEIRLDLPLSLAVYRIAQEALLNAARHAQATRVEVRLTRRGKWLSLQVQDDGCGMTDHEAAGRETLGLAEMRERALSLGGELKINSIPADGTLVALRVPVHGDHDTLNGSTAAGNVC